MIGLALLLASTQARMSLQYYQGAFFISDGPFVFAAPMPKPQPQQTFVRFRRGDTYTVWDKRGLDIRAGNWIYDTRFKDLAVSPKLFSKEEIHENLLKAKEGQRALEATAISGALRLGTIVYFVPRWIDCKGYTWLEAVVEIDLSAKHPKPVLIGRLPGRTLASGSIDQRLFALREQPAAIIRKGDEWGIAFFDPISGLFSYSHIGERLRAYSQLEGNNIAFVEAEDGGLNRVGVADVATGDRTDVLEDRGNIRMLDDNRPLCAIVNTTDQTTIRNLQTGSAMDLPTDSTALRTAEGILVWWPRIAPKHAVLLDPARWEGLANWQLPEKS